MALQGNVVAAVIFLVPAIAGALVAWTEIAHLFESAAKSYHENPTALHLRAMNMLYEGLRKRGY